MRNSEIGVAGFETLFHHPFHRNSLFRQKYEFSP
jgi:hypothetical protein